MDEPAGKTIIRGLLLAVLIAIGCASIGFALYSLSEWMATGRLYSGNRSTRAWRTYEQDPQGFVISAVFCVALVVMPLWYFISKRHCSATTADTRRRFVSRHYGLLLTH